MKRALEYTQSIEEEADGPEDNTDSDSMTCAPPVAPALRASASIVGTYYGAMYKPATLGELLRQFRCEQEIRAGAYGLYLPHACYLDRDAIVELDESGRRFGCRRCQRVHDCERDRHTCPVYEYDDEMLCWFSKKPRDKTEFGIDYTQTIPLGMNKARASLKEIHIPVATDKRGKDKLLRSANALAYDANASKHLRQMAVNHGKNMHGIVAINAYKQQMKRIEKKGKPKKQTFQHVTEEEQTAAEAERQLEATFRESTYHRDEYKRDNEFYINYYLPIWSSDVAAAAKRLYAKTCPSRTVHDEPVKQAAPTARPVSETQRAPPVELQGLYSEEVCPRIPDYQINIFRGMIKSMVDDLVQLFGNGANVSMARIVYYADRVYMLVGLFHPTCLNVWKWDELVKYTLICIVGLFRQTLTVRGVVLWVGDTHLAALDVRLEKIKFQHDYMEAVWQKIGGKFGKKLDHFIKPLRESAIPLTAIRTIVHATPVLTNQ